MFIKMSRSKIKQWNMGSMWGLGRKKNVENQMKTRKDLPEKVALQLRPEGSERGSHVDI